MGFGRIASVAGFTSLILFGGFLYIQSVRASIDDESVKNQAVVQNDGTVESDETTVIKSCCDRLKTGDKKPYIFVSTLDGRISAFDASSEDGRLVWSMQTDVEPLLSSSLSNIPFYADDVEYRLIPSLDGHLYMYNDAVVQSVPFSVDALLSGSLKLGADVLSGGKLIRTHFVDPATGKIHQTCSSVGCENFGDNSTPPFRKLIIKRTTQTVRAVDPGSGAERWNVTVGEHELLLDDFEIKDDDNSPCICLGTNEQFSYDNSKPPSTRSDHHSNRMYLDPSDIGNVDLKIVPPQGLLLAYDKSDPGVLLWEAKLESPIVQIWTLSPAGVLLERSIFEHTLVPAFSYYSISEAALAELAGRTVGGQMERTIYIGTYNDQKYVIRSPEERRKKDLKGYGQNDQGRVYLLAPAAQLELEDQSRVGGHCGGDCPTCASEEVNSLILREQYPKDMGWYLYKHKTSSHGRLLLPHSPDQSKSKRSKQHDFAVFLDNMPSWQFCVLTLSALSAFFIPAILVARLYARQLRESKEMAEKCLNKEDKPPTPGTPTASPDTETTRLAPSTRSPTSDSVLSELVGDLTGRSYGRYSTDFEPIRQLGRGGFGIVVESRNTHDDQLYAVKRIAFALKSSAKERVRREVKALAQLDHPGVVRYFSAWFEEPPADWQKKMDKDMFQKCHRSDCDELSLESASRIRSNNNNNKSKDDLECVAPKVGPAGDVGSNDYTGTEASTFGTWTDDPNLPSADQNDQKPIDDASMNEPKQRVAFQRPLQESVEIIFAHSATTAGTSAPILEPVLPRTRNRKSTSSKHSSTKSEEEREENTRIEPKPLGTAYLYIQMQLCRGTLKDWLLANNSVEDRDRATMLDLFDQLVCAMQYVHDLGLVHRDLKPSNIFFSATGMLKIGDFGLATKTLPTSVSLPVHLEMAENAAGDEKYLASSIATVSPSHGTTDRVGTQLYMSPEQEMGRKCTSKADIYALGLIFVELLVPFKTLMERVHVIQDARRNSFPEHFERDYGQEDALIRRLLSHDPDQRPTCLEIRKDDLFKPYWAIRPLFDKSDFYQPGGRTVSRDSGRHSSLSLNTP